MKRRIIWVGGALLAIIIVLVSVWRWQQRHATRFDVTVYCQGMLYFPTAITQQQGDQQPCGLIPNNGDFVGAVSIAVYHQSCFLGSGPLIVTPMHTRTFACTISGSSQFTDADDAAIASETVGRCLSDESVDILLPQNGPCRLYVTEVGWG